jgi:HAD superfamily hydrolase (TIGR01509 family)
VLRSEGIELARDDYYTRLIGYNDHDCFAAVLGENTTPAGEERIGRLIERKAALYQRMVGEREVLYPGAERFVRRCARRFALVVVTGTLRVEAEMILSRAGLRGLFLDVIAAEDVARGKPEPDGFVAALGRLNKLLPRPVAAGECLVIEDTAAGIQAARRAGMKVLAVKHTSAQADLESADLVRPSFDEIDLDDVAGRLAG